MAKIAFNGDDYAFFLAILPLSGCGRTLLLFMETSTGGTDG